MASFDPLAGSQINVDPSLKPKDADLAKKRAELIQRFLNAGATQEQAEAEADRLIANHPVLYGQQTAAPAPQAPPAPPSPQESMEADLYAQGYSADEARKQAQLQAEMQAERERAQLEMDLSQGGYGQRRVPSPRGIDGRSTQGAPFASLDEAQQYESRSELPNGGYSESQKDRDMRARGMTPVIGPDGSVTYMLGYTEDGVLPGGPGRPGYRGELISSGKYQKGKATGLDGSEVEVLVPTEQFRGQMVDQNARVREAQDRRNPYKDMASPAERMKRFQAQIQLGGGRLSPQSIQLETLLNGMDPEQRQRAMQYMAPGGALAAQVDARNLEAAAGLARNAVVGVLGQQGQGNPLVDLQVRQQTREMNAALEDGIGESHAPGGWWGYDDFTIGEQQQMYDELINTHGYSEEQARSAVDSQARKRRATQRLFGAGPAPQAPGAPAEPDVEPRPGVGTPGNKPRGGKGDGGKRKPADPPKDRPSNQTGRGASRNRNRPGDARPRN